MGNGPRGRDSANYRVPEDQTNGGESRTRQQVAFEKQHEKLKVLDNMDKDTSILN